MAKITQFRKPKLHQELSVFDVGLILNLIRCFMNLYERDDDMHDNSVYQIMYEYYSDKWKNFDRFWSMAETIDFDTKVGLLCYDKKIELKYKAAEIDIPLVFFEPIYDSDEIIESMIKYYVNNTTNHEDENKNACIRSLSKSYIESIKDKIDELIRNYDKYNEEHDFKYLKMYVFI